MILPIVAYGDPVLRKKTEKIDKNNKNLSQTIDNMWETMYAASGVGLAAPQVGLSFRLFIVDASPFSNDENLDRYERKELKNFKCVFINPEIITQMGATEDFNEGCLSIPNIREDVARKTQIKIKFQDINFKSHTLVLDGIAARIVLHEYDHIEGILFTDRLSSLKKRLLKSRLSQISKGNIVSDYKMRFPHKKFTQS